MSLLNNLPGPALSLGSVRVSYGRPGPDPHRPGPHPLGSSRVQVAPPPALAGRFPGSSGAAARTRGEAVSGLPPGSGPETLPLAPAGRGAPGPRMQDRREREYWHRDEDPHGPGDEDDDEPTVRSTPPVPGRRGPGWRDPVPGRFQGRGGSGAGEDPGPGRFQGRGGSGAGEDPGSACVISCPLNEIPGPGPARAGAGLRNASSARRNPPRLLTWLIVGRLGCWGLVVGGIVRVAWVEVRTDVGV